MTIFDNQIFLLIMLIITSLALAIVLWYENKHIWKKEKYTIMMPIDKFFRDREK